MRAIFEISQQLAADREITEHGPQRLTHQELAAWQFNTQHRLTPFEVRALRALDAVQLKVECNG